MLKLFFIFIIYIYNIYACRNNYCEICPNHTLCKYEISGPSSTCSDYDFNASLTENNIKALVDHVNYRRNFIALGHSNFLPGAANMKKIIWSQELATSAQRWVDQCDQELRPDKKDECRNLENIKVGQNIATITGPSPGFNVKSFVEMWFMQSLDYGGGVTYYNESRGYKSNQFTQLIWADTEKIGCGKAKFTVKNFKTTIVERLICNFAPRGNVHGKPVYIIGYAATQCPDRMISDKIFTGLCSRPVNTNNILDNKKFHTGISVTPLATSLLRIRNLFNDSAKKEIDPVYNNLKQMEKNSRRGCLQKDKNPSSTIVQDIFLDAVKRSHPLENGNFWIHHRNSSQNYVDNLHQDDKGHSWVYHGHDHRNKLDSIHPEILNKDSRRYDVATTLLTYSNEQYYRKQNMNQQCTRDKGSKIFSQTATGCVHCKQNVLKCTRGQKCNSEILPRICEGQEWQSTIQTYPHNFCGCNHLRTTCPGINRCIQNTNCECVSVTCPMKRCPHMLRTLGDSININIEKLNDFHYYDLMSDKSPKRHSKILHNVEQEENRNTYKSFRSLNNQNIKLFNEKKEYNPNYSDFKRSIPEDDSSFKPFWQIDGYSNKKQPQLKSIRYTTLANKKNRKSKRTKNIPKTEFKTEHITLKFNKDQTANSKRITEKYLSFDELMHLRKFNTGNYSGRRLHDIKPDDNEGKNILRDSDTSNQDTESTLEYTANTPFIRMKHCTRKLTCTWTAASLTDSAGSVIPGGAGGAAGHMGSRTPPGYVEGCTRTSTCTRDYMNRNKMATLHIETTSPEFDSGDDEDYCERRSLSRRNCVDNFLNRQINENNPFLSHNNSLNISANNEIRYVNETLNHCICFNKNIRSKRNNRNKNIEKEKILNYRNVKRENIYFSNDEENNVLSYSDLYYYVLTKILNTWKRKKSLCSNSKCVCNKSSEVGRCNLLMYMSIFIFIK